MMMMSIILKIFMIMIIIVIPIQVGTMGGALHLGALESKEHTLQADWNDQIRLTFSNEILCTELG